MVTSGVGDGVGLALGLSSSGGDGRVGTGLMTAGDVGG
jgi:hypothetical protein